MGIDEVLVAKIVSALQLRFHVPHHAVLEIQVLENRLDDHIELRETLVVHGRGDPAQLHSGLECGDRAPLHALADQVVDVLHAPVQALRGHVLQPHRQPGLYRW
jgi:hypothetical protein